MPNEDFIPLLPFYVYVLIDPITEKVFYVGKGTNGRVENHTKEVLNKIENENELTSPKELRIKQILDQMDEPLEIIIARFHTEEKALAVEAVLIKWVYGFPNLTNLVHGHDSEYIREINDLSEVPHLDVPAPVRRNDGVFSEENIKKLEESGANGLLSYIKERLGAKQYAVRDFSEKSDRPFNPGQSNGWLGRILRINYVDFIIGFSHSCKPQLSIANTCYSRTPEALRQLAKIEEIKGSDFKVGEPKNILVDCEGTGRQGRYRDFKVKPKFTVENLEGLFVLLDELKEIR